MGRVAPEGLRIVLWKSGRYHLTGNHRGELISIESMDQQKLERIKKELESERPRHRAPVITVTCADIAALFAGKVVQTPAGWLRPGPDIRAIAAGEPQPDRETYELHVVPRPLPAPAPEPPPVVKAKEPPAKPTKKPGSIEEALYGR